MKKFALTVAAMLASASAVPAYSQAFTGGAGTFTNLGDDGRNSGFDVVDFAPLTGLYTATALTI